jgi:hypothetical protein
MLVAFAGRSNADLVIANAPATGPWDVGTQLGNADNIAGDRNWKAYGITTTASGTFTFTSMRIAADNSEDNSHVISGGIYANNGGIPSNTLVPNGAFVNQIIPEDSPLGTQLTFTTSSTVTLLPSTTYWFVLTSEVFPGNGGVNWNEKSPSAAPTASGVHAGQVNLLGYRFSSNNRSTWGTSTLPNALAIDLAFVPEAGGFLCGGVALAATGAGYFLRRRKPCQQLP